MEMDMKAVRAFRTIVWRHYRAHGRHDLPWRKTQDPYKILVSEMMLQQTQVPRVVEKDHEFLAAFPTVRALADASLAEVLRVWSGMGYNRRAKYLREAAIVIVREHGGRVPQDAPALRSIPGVGPYTAAAVRVFAFNLPDTMIETNIRAALIHHFFPSCDSKNPNWENRVDGAGVSVGDNGGKGGEGQEGRGITDRDLLPLIARAAEGQDPRTWHWALMDYGAHIKKVHGNPARRSAHHVKQSKFEGSLRQVRGAILRELHADKPVVTKLPFEQERIQSALAGLARDGLICKVNGKWRIA